MNPGYCPCDREELEEGVTCKSCCYSPYDTGAGSFCIGKTELCKKEIQGIEHVNGYIFCIRYGKEGEEENVHVSHTNKKDMEILHDMLHRGVGFMHHEEDEESGWYTPEKGT